MVKRQRPAPIDRGGPQQISFIEKLKHRFAPIDLRFMPPPCYVCKIQHCFQVSPYFLAAVLFGLAGASAPAVSAVVLEVARFNFALREFLFLALPKEPIAIFPFLDFLSPLPMFKKFMSAIITKEIRIRKWGRIIIRTLR